jgi:hypothetical protein
MPPSITLEHRVEMFKIGAIVNEVSQDTEHVLSILERWDERFLQIAGSDTNADFLRRGPIRV